MAARTHGARDPWRWEVVRARWWNVGFIGFELAAGLAVHAAGYSWLQVGLLFAVLIAVLLAGVVAIVLIVPGRARRRHERELAAWAAQRDARPDAPVLTLTTTTGDRADSTAGAVAA